MRQMTLVGIMLLNDNCIAIIRTSVLNVKYLLVFIWYFPMLVDALPKQALYGILLTFICGVVFLW